MNAFGIVYKKQDLLFPNMLVKLQLLNEYIEI